MLGFVTSPVPYRLPLTYRDYCQLPEDGRRYELMEGDLFVSPAPSTEHQTVLGRLLFELMRQLDQRGLAVTFAAPVDVILEDTSVVQPDIIVVATDRKHLITKRALEGPPDIAVEILSQSSIDRDRHLKRRLFERFAVPEYWIVDAEHGMVDVLHFIDGGYRQVAKLDRASTLTSRRFPDLAIVLEPIFRPL
jgi:Uma2 family endonuclease